MLMGSRMEMNRDGWGWMEMEAMEGDGGRWRRWMEMEAMEGDGGDGGKRQTGRRAPCP
jgi:hypothetical protein